MAAPVATPFMSMAYQPNYSPGILGVNQPYHFTTPSTVDAGYNSANGQA